MIDLEDEIIDFAELRIESTFKIDFGEAAPSRKFHSVTSAHSAFTSQERKSSKEIIEFNIESINPLIPEIAPNAALKIPFTADNICPMI